jgi:hypothetical protein
MDCVLLKNESIPLFLQHRDVLEGSRRADLHAAYSMPLFAHLQLRTPMLRDPGAFSFLFFRRFSRLRKRAAWARRPILLLSHPSMDPTS